MLMTAPDTLQATLVYVVHAKYKIAKWCDIYLTYGTI
jgi:hypothetical protein